MENPHIVGDTVYLRPVEMEDRDRFVAWLNDEQARGGLGSIHPVSRLAEEEYLRTQLKKQDQVFLSIVEKASGRHIGSTGLHGINPVHRHCTFGLLIGDRTAWGKGYGTETTRLMVDYAFRKLNLNRVELHVFSYNTRAIAVYEKAGFVREGVLRQYQYHDGAYHDDIVMSVIRDDLR